MKNKRILVTGSSGFIGMHLVLELRKLGAEVLTFDKSERKNFTRWKDFKDISNIDLVYNLAAVTFVPFSQKNPRATYETNIQGTINILELCRINNSKVIFTSSYVYGKPKYLPIDEKHPISPSNPYAKSKIICEMLCKHYHDDYGLNCIIFQRNHRKYRFRPSLSVSKQED